MHESHSISLSTTNTYKEQIDDKLQAIHRIKTKSEGEKKWHSASW